MTKLRTLKEAIGLIKNGDSVAFGGNVLHRSPMAAVREIARQGKANLKLIKTAGAMDIDLLCAMDCVASVDAGFVSYETKFGLANHYRRAVQAGKVKANEHACYTVICALRAAAMNVPFMPVHGLKTGDLLTKNDYFVVVEDPFGGEPVTLVKTLTPDVAILHVHACDENGNAVIHGPKFEDVLLSRAAKRVIVISEQMMPENRLKQQPEQVDIPSLLVHDVVHVPGGAAPGSCYKRYEVDTQSVMTFLSLMNREEIEAYLKRYEARDYAGERRRTWKV